MPIHAGCLANSHSPHLLETLMKNRIRTIIGLVILCAALGSAALASDNAYMYLVHGVPGLDYAAGTDPEFPVDVLINDEVCYQRGLAFGTISGPLTLAPGSYDVKISIANSLAPCSNAPIVDSTVTLGAGKNVSAVFALDSKGAATLLKFTNNFSAVPANSGRLLFALAADSPAVQLIVENTSTKKLYTYSVNPGALLSATRPAGVYTVEVNEGTSTLVPSTTVVLDSQSVALLYAVGEAGNNTVTMESKTVRDVI
jgi:Domain of unknown function (DUF4397)